jgi:hypothetical protein
LGVDWAGLPFFGVGGGRVPLGALAAEHLVLDAADRVLEDLPELAHGVVADGLRMPDRRAQIPRELLGKPLKITVGARV